MDIISAPQNLKRLIVSIGTFDGVHRGHRFLIGYLCREAALRDLACGVVTFSNHPQSVVNPQSVTPMLTTLSERLSLLEQTGINACLLLDFDDTLRNLTAEEFIARLHNRYGADALVVGYDNRFGRNRSEGFRQYCEIGARVGVEIIQAPELTGESGNISSSTIRSLLQVGDIAAANAALGYEYSLTGTVVAGKQLGRTIGFPTANINVADTTKLIPANGVYAAIAVTADGSRHKAMVNIGHRPTVDTINAPITIEAHLLDLNRDLYGEPITIVFVAFQRVEKRFNSLDELTSQLEEDRRGVNQLLRKGS